ACKGFYPPPVVIIIQGGPNGAHRTDLANDTCLWEPKLPTEGRQSGGGRMRRFLARILT
ncbi:unnamed protein product, partial [Brassica napus]